MNLCDREISELGESLISPFNPKQVQPASYDLTLSPNILIPNGAFFLTKVDLRSDKPSDFMKEDTIDSENGYVLAPNRCLLASTNELIKCPDNMVARVEGKSSLGRIFLACHVTAGFVDPGFCGNITLEIVNHASWGIVLWPGMKIAQVNFARLSGPCHRPYGSVGLGSHYQGQQGPVAASGKRGQEE